MARRARRAGVEGSWLGTRDPDAKGYWVIAPYSADPPETWQRVWEFDLANDVISIGWEELGNVAALDEQGLSAAIDRTSPEASTQGKGMVFKMVWDFFHEIKLGDVILAARDEELAAVGTVTRTAYHDPGKSPTTVNAGFVLANHLGVRWDAFPRDKQFPNPVFGLQTVYKTSEEKYRTLLGKPIGERRLVALRLLLQKEATSPAGGVNLHLPRGGEGRGRDHVRLRRPLGRGPGRVAEAGRPAGWYLLPHRRRACGPGRRENRGD